MKQYKESTKQIVANAVRFAEDMRALGLTRQGAAESLKRMLEGKPMIFTSTEPAGMFGLAGAQPLVEPRKRTISGAKDVSQNLYLHGEAEAFAGFDIARLVEGDLLMGHEYSGEPCEVETPKGRIPCLLFVWDAGYKVTGMSSGKELRQFQGLIVACSDAASIEYAGACMAERRKFL